MQLHNNIQIVYQTSHMYYKKIFKQVFIFLLKKNNLSNLFIRELSLTKNKKFTLLKSPHIFKNARDQFEIRKEVMIFNVSNFTRRELGRILNVLKFLSINLITHSRLVIKNNVVKFF
jgi:hypothetical protein